jgi:UDP-N-acetylglucosamine transferase subunit ALG13
MIFVSVGTNEARFDRLLRGVADLTIDEELIVQYGHSSPIAPATAELVDFLSFDAMLDTIRRSRAFVTHAGVGSIMVALAQEKRPIVVPRRRALGEAVDDHQLELGRRFAASGMVTLVDSVDGLAGALSADESPTSLARGVSALGADLRDFLAARIAPTTPASRP